MGIFNFFIVIPQIVVAILVSRAMDYFPRVNRLAAVVFLGVRVLSGRHFNSFPSEDRGGAATAANVAEEEGVLPTVTPPESLITSE